jgi:hypothetical protein
VPLLLIGLFEIKQKRLFIRSAWHFPTREKKVNEPERRFHLAYLEPEEKKFEILIGNGQCSQPFATDIFNISSMHNLLENFTSQQIGGRKLDCFKDTRDERLSAYSLTNEDLVLQIKPNDDCLRTVNSDNLKRIFKENACLPEVKMIELLLTAIEPLQKANSSCAVAESGFNTKPGIEDFSGTSCPGFTDAEAMIHFLDSLRQLSGGKPVGIRLSVTDKRNFFEICYAIRKTQFIPDFIVVEGSLEGGITVFEEKNIPAIMPLYEALLFVSQTLRIYRLEKEVKVIAFAAITSCFDMLKILALGAGAVYMDPSSYNLFTGKTSSFYKKENLDDFHYNIMKAMGQAMKMYGFESISEITVSKIFRRLHVAGSNGLKASNVLYPADECDLKPIDDLTGRQLSGISFSS